MSLGTSLAQARRKAGLTQEAVAEKLGVSRQTISKWELDETLPDIRQSKRLAMLYRVTLDALIDFDIEAQELAEMTLSVPDEVAEKVDWTAVCGRRNIPSLRAIPRKSRQRRIWKRSPDCWRSSRRITATATRMRCLCSRTFSASSIRKNERRPAGNRRFFLFTSAQPFVIMNNSKAAEPSAAEGRASS